MLDPVGDDRQAERREAPRIAIGVENEAVALRLKPLDDAGENRAPTNLAQRLVAAAHSPREPAGQNDARRAGTRHARPLARSELDPSRTIRACRPMALTRLDLSGLKCPLPALKVRKALKSLAPGDRLEVR